MKPCPMCGEQIQDQAVKCRFCGSFLEEKPGAAPPEGPAGAVDTLIPVKNPMALIAYYLGVFSLIPCLGAPLAPAALILGILGLRAVKTKNVGTGHAIAGIVLGGIVSLIYVGLFVVPLVAR